MNFDQVIERRGTDCAKYDAYAEHGYSKDILPLWVADMDFRAPECVIEALHKAVDHGIFGYSIRSERYFPALQKWFLEYFDWEIEESWLHHTPGVVFALSAAVRATTKPGDNVLVLPPVYYPFYRVIVDNDRGIVKSELTYENGRYTMNFADIEEKIANNDVKALIFCSPHNPVGRVWTVEELQTLGAICKKHNVAVISDEIHCDFAFPEHPHTPFVKACPDLLEQTVICTAASKTFNLAGLQASNIFIPGEELRKRFKKELDIAAYHDVNRLGAVAATAAYEGGAQWLTECKAYMRENLNYVRNFLAARLPKIKLVEPEGTYLAWLDCSGLGLSKEALDDLMVNKANLWLDTGSIFGQCAKQFQRIVLACPRATLEKAMEQLANAVSGL